MRAATDDRQRHDGRRRRVLAGIVALTPAGRAVLNGKADRVRHSGIDRWLGGVHVHGRGPVWRRSARTAALVHV